MINGINGMTVSQTMMQGPPPPKGNDVFQLSDSDGNGLVSQTELESLVDKIEEVSGKSINVEESLSSYDVNQDGGLSGEELFEMLGSSGFAPPPMMVGDEAAGEGGRTMQSPPPPQFEQAMAAYGQTGSDDSLSQLLDLLQENSTNDEYSGINVSS